jgi:hypothetical protein
MTPPPPNVRCEGRVRIVLSAAQPASLAQRLLAVLDEL